MTALFAILTLLGAPELYPDAEDFINGDGVAQSTLDMNGNDIVTDADGDSRWEHGTDDQLQLYLNSNVVALFANESIVLYDTNADNQGGDIALGNTTSAGVLLRRASSGLLNVRLGDNSDYASLRAGAITAYSGLSANDMNITNVGDIDTDSISADGTTVNYEDVNILELTQEDVGATCTLGQIRYDTGGANHELCICQATNTWYCATLAAGPAD